MTHGKRICKILKEIRQQIADNNGIEYVTSECHFQGECKGTCPKCESEVRYLENELNKRRQLGKVITIAGISLGVAGSFSACNISQQENIQISESENPIEVVKQDTIEVDTNFSYPPIPQKFILEGIISDGELVIEVGGIEPEDETRDTIIPIEEHYEDENEFEDF